MCACHCVCVYTSAGSCESQKLKITGSCEPPYVRAGAEPTISVEIVPTLNICDPDGHNVSFKK